MLRRDYLQKISSDLLFSEEVVRAHAAHTLPYDRSSIQDAYNYTSIIKRERKQFVGPVGRYNSRVSDQHLPCHIKKRSHHRLEPLRKKKPQPIISSINEEDKEREKANSDSVNKPTSKAFLTEDPAAIEGSAEEANAKQVKAKHSQSWDEHLLLHLSKNTAAGWLESRRLRAPRKTSYTECSLTCMVNPQATWTRSSTMMSVSATLAPRRLSKQHPRRGPSSWHFFRRLRRSDREIQRRRKTMVSTQDL